MRAFAAVLLVVLLATAIVGWLVLDRGVAEPLVPDPETVVQTFMTSLSARRYEPARQQLSDDLRAQTSVADLRRLDDALRERYGAYAFELGGSGQQAGDRATYRARVDTERGGTVTPAFELERSAGTGLWEITSLEELRAHAR